VSARSATDRLRFLVVHPKEFPGPEANLVQTAESCRALAERGHEVFLFAGRLLEPTTEACLRQLGVEPHPDLFLVEEPSLRLRDSGRVGSIFVRATLLWYLWNLRSRKRTVLYVRTLRDSRMVRFVLFAGRRLRVPVIYEAHKIYTEKRRDQGRHEGTLRRVSRLERLVFERADGVVATHPLLYERIRAAHRPSAPMVVAENGVPLLDRTTRTPEFDLVYTGSLFEWKGVDICLDAVARIPSATLAIVGGNPAARLEELTQRAARLGITDRVTFFGQRSRAEALERLAEARVALVPLDPGFVEGERYTCPLKMLEALMRGIPLVAADTPAIRAFVEHEKTALLTPRGDIDAMASAVQRFMEDRELARRLADAGRARAMEFTFAARAAKIDAFARSLL